MRILINDFIGGVLDRGIPLYVRNLIEGFNEEGFRVTVVRAPTFCRKLPRSLFYALAVLFEQTLVPLYGALMRTDLTIYPYNSIAVLDALSGRGRIVVHDLEQLNRGPSPSKLYYLVCYRVLKRLRRPIFTIAELTRQRLIASGCFGDAPIGILPNTFYAFERLVRAQDVKREDKSSILLCTGSTANKDLETLVAQYLPRVLAAGFRVSILGLHKTGDAPRLATLSASVASGQLRLCGQLSDGEVAGEYKAHEIVWVHSLREGFGRCVVEGRLAGGRVLCTDIPEFTQLRDPGVSFYRDADGLMTALDALIHNEAKIGPYNGYPYRALLRQAIDGGL